MEKNYFNRKHLQQFLVNRSHQITAFKKHDVDMRECSYYSCNQMYMQTSSKDPYINISILYFNPFLYNKGL